MPYIVTLDVFCSYGLAYRNNIKVMSFVLGVMYNSEARGKSLLTCTDIDHGSVEYATHALKMDNWPDLDLILHTIKAQKVYNLKGEKCNA